MSYTYPNVPQCTLSVIRFFLFENFKLGTKFILYTFSPKKSHLIEKIMMMDEGVVTPNNSFEDVLTDSGKETGKTGKVKYSGN